MHKIFSHFIIALVLGTLAPAALAYDAVQFMHLVERDDARSTSKALAEGMDPNTKNKEGFSALYVALREPSPAVASLLIDHPHTRINEANAFGETPLMMAALRNQLPQAKRLIEKGVDPNKPGWAALHYAASGGHVEMTRLLLDNHAYIDAESPHGETPLMMAARHGNVQTVQLLLEAGADATLKTKEGKTAMEYALDGNNSKSAKAIAVWINKPKIAARASTSINASAPAQHAKATHTKPARVAQPAMPGLPEGAGTVFQSSGTGAPPQ